MDRVGTCVKPGHSVFSEVSTCMVGTVRMTHEIILCVLILLCFHVTRFCLRFLQQTVKLNMPELTTQKSFCCCFVSDSILVTLYPRCVNSPMTSLSLSRHVTTMVMALGGRSTGSQNSACTQPQNCSNQNIRQLICKDQTSVPRPGASKIRKHLGLYTSAHPTSHPLILPP